MNKILEVREYDRISCNPADKYTLPENVFKKLEEFIYQYEGNEEHADILDFFKIGFHRNVGNIKTFLDSAPKKNKCVPYK
jgi:hypothetical protein